MSTGMGRKRAARGTREADIDDVGDEGSDLDIRDELGNPITEDSPVPDIEDEPSPIVAEREKPEADEEAFKILERERDNARAALAVEQKRSKDLEARVSANTDDLDATNAAILKNAAAQARADVEAAQLAFEAAMTASDFKAAGKAQALIAEKTAEAREYEAAGVEFERERKAPKATAAADPAPAVAQSDDDKIRAYLTPNTAEWVIKNKAVVLKSKASWQRTLAAHEAAVEAGHEIDTPEYLQFIEKDMNITAVTVVRDEPKPTTQKKRPPPMAAAPPNRGTQAGAGGTVTLSAAERATAKRMGMSVTKYAAHKKRALDLAADPDYSGPKYSQHNPAMSGRR